ncbi:Rab family GTPase [Pelomyxa schiedti]|nr:Rab family GTPase [Pelomyxa schiedti]
MASTTSAATASTTTDLKLAVIGPSGSGKTTMIRRLLRKEVDVPYKPTIAGDFCSVPFDHDGVKRTVAVWDTAGQERYAKLSRLYYKDSNAVFLVYDVSDRQSFDGLRPFWEDAKEVLDRKSVVFYVIGNKTDLGEAVDQHTVEAWCDENGFTHMTCSARTGDNLQRIFESIIMDTVHRQSIQEVNLLNDSQALREPHLVRVEEPVEPKKKGCC